jgi:DNA-directed RNA polymerase
VLLIPDQDAHSVFLLTYQDLVFQVRHMVMPYMPMLVHPRPWLGFNEGGYLHLKSSIMRTQGTKEQRMAVMDTPRESMKKVMEVKGMTRDVIHLVMFPLVVLVLPL